ncbi:acyl-CoA thioesterase [Caldinitratiruptor microaerophilus]|uniref:Acyl-CoA thioesterase n=1 Tax=Caldinitratiruptor microaerophilus TaxID=671077 RepID=A0AA35CN60_9FIRM|nr:acyl-CoA thioesterase [Caldinitratiruptor microaerophilus]BDG62385.1 hypothetical protein caldi_34750 [Caldinitratiruptor microaerophilus]
MTGSENAAGRPPDAVDREWEVTWGDCDPAGIVYNPRYLEWFTLGRITYLRKWGVPYGEAFRAAGVEAVVYEAHLRILRPSRPEDRVLIRTWIAELSRSRLRFSYQVLDPDGQVLAEGYTTHAYVDASGRPFDLAKRAPALWERLSRLPVSPPVTTLK